MDSITPEYYPQVTSTTVYRFEIDGSFLANLPDDAMAWFSNSNTQPTMGIGAYWPLYLVEKSFFHAVFERSTYFTVPVYLGCITSADGSKVYWVNTSQPLPS